jgi:hypothetical protein
LDPLHPSRPDVVAGTTTIVVVVEGLGVTTTVTVTDGGAGSTDGGAGSVVVSAAEFVGDKAVAAQGVPTNMKSVVIIIQASCDCSDKITISTLWAAARSSIVK